MPYLTTKKEITWYYEVCGQGSPLLFLHGWGASSMVFVQQVEYFSQKYKVILVDLPGHGKTTWKPISFNDIADDMDCLLREMNVSPVSLVGSSMGGAVGLRFYERFPQRVERLIMVGSLPRFCRNPDIPLGLDRAQFEKLKGQLEHKYPSILDIFFRSLFTMEERENPKFQWIHQFRKQENIPRKEALIYFLDMLGKEDFLAMLKDIKIPLQFIAGDHDYICPPDSIAFLKEMLPQARFNTIEKSGHFPFLIKSAEFNRTVEQFLLEKI
jgi:pimeloyl-[acyl-carrier protein] methyl ester esterase